eukprot:scaffold1827_cov421-Prasinococcus_capsulatus_cf.AAC.44
MHGQQVPGYDTEAVFRRELAPVGLRPCGVFVIPMIQVKARQLERTQPMQRRLLRDSFEKRLEQAGKLVVLKPAGMLVARLGCRHSCILPDPVNAPRMLSNPAESASYDHSEDEDTFPDDAGSLTTVWALSSRHCLGQSELSSPRTLSSVSRGSEEGRRLCCLLVPRWLHRVEKGEAGGPSSDERATYPPYTPSGGVECLVTDWRWRLGVVGSVSDMRLAAGAIALP